MFEESWKREFKKVNEFCFEKQRSKGTSQEMKVD